MAEKKDIAQLDFNIDSAINKLKQVDKELETISKSSEEYAKKIGANISKSLNVENIIDSKAVKKEAQQTIKITEDMVQNVIDNDKKGRREIVEEEQRHQNRMIEMNHKAELARERDNERLVNSTKTVYDQIADYAKTYLIYQGFNQLKQGIAETIDEMVDLESQMVQIDRVLNESSLNIDSYRDKLLNLAYDYGNSMNNVTDIALRLAQAGYSSNEVLALTEKTLLALNTAELNATEATSDMVAVMAQWGLMTGTATEQAKQYGDIIDKINIVADNYPTTSADIMDALKKVSSAFNLAGASIDETIATITAAEIASQRGGKAIGTALSNITQQLKDEGRLTIAESLGLDFFTDATKTEFKGIMDIFKEMSDKMQELKNSGKENSVEMQNLLSVFTVFRRNIGASLLGEMGGEMSKYDEIMKTLTESTGYSLQENEKYLKTVKAQQEQFNATLLKLKTEVWDGGVEDVYKGLLSLGNDVAKSAQWIIKTFGTLPTAIGLATAGFTMFNKQLKLTISYNSMKDKFKFSWTGELIDKINKAKEEVKLFQNSLKDIRNLEGVKFSKEFDDYVSKVGVANVSTEGFIGYLKKLKAAEVAAEIETIALNAALSLGLSVAITTVIKLFDNLIHAEEKQIEKYNEIIEKNTDEIDKLEQENEKIEDLIKNYEELQNVQSTDKDIAKSQKDITNYLIKQNEYTKEMVNNYDLQIQKLKEIQRLNRERELKDAENALKAAQEMNKGKGQGIFNWLFPGSTMGVDIALTNANLDFSKLSEKSGKTITSETEGIWSILGGLDLDKQLEVLKDFEEQLQTTGQYGSKAWTLIEGKIKDVESKTNQLTEAQKEYNSKLLESQLKDVIKSEDISTLEEYNKALEDISNIEPPENWTGSVEDFRARLTALLQNEFPEYREQTVETTDEINNNKDAIAELITKTEELQSKYTILTTAQNELNESGQLTVATFKSLVDKDLLQFLEVSNGKLKINTKSMEDLAEANRIAAIETLKNQAIMDLENLTLGETENLSTIAKNALEKLKEKTDNVGQSAETTTGKLMEMNTQLDLVAENAARAVGDDPTTGISVEDYKKKANAIINAYKDIAKAAGSITISSAKSSKSGSTAAAEAAAKREAEAAAEAAKKAEEEAYKARLKQFKDYMSEKERIEKRWVSNQKELGLLSNKDYMYITQQRIERYKAYLEEIKKATWMNEEDRLELEKKYTEEIEDLQVDYLGYIEKQLNEEIKAYQDANKEKIQAIKDEADARIDALKKVENETDRIRAKEEYEKKRQEHLDDISYWEQRTGREAQEALQEARKNLQELDEDWQEQLEDWSIEDQIKGIEQQRDAEIKAIEDAKAKEIESMKAIYDAKVQMFTETGELIYEESTIQAQNLYKSYKTNFIDPVKADLAELNKVTAQPVQQTSAPQQQYESYTIKSGDTLSKIAKNFGTTVEKILEANPYITNKNKIYAGKMLQIPKFHGGGEFGGIAEGLAILKKGEVVLRPEWTSDMKTFNKYIKSIMTSQGKPLQQGPSIDVKGDLIRIDANIKDKADAEYLTRKLEKMLKDKFNIKK